MTRSERMIQRLPHRPPLRMISEVLEVERCRAVCVAEVDASLCSLWGDGRNAFAYVGVELLAQTAAIAIGCVDEEAGPQSGMLVQVRRLALLRQELPLGSKVRCEVAVDLGLEGRFAVARGECFLGDEKIVEAQLSLAIERG